MNPLTPAYDNKIPKKYSARTLDQKPENKLALQESLGWPEDNKVFLVCVPLELLQATNADRMLELVPALQALGIQLLVVGKGERAYGEKMSELQQKAQNMIHIIKDEEEALRLMYAAADAAVFTSNPAGTEELNHALQYGTVPICPPCNEVENYNPIQESGCAFVYTGESIWHLFAAVVRAKETYVFPYDYRTVQRQCMQQAGIVDEVEEDEE